MSKKKTHEEYVEELAIKNPNIEVVGRYIDSKTPILHYCKIDGNLWEVIPNNILRGHGCPMCANNMKITHEQYVDKVNSMYQNIEVIERYINAKTPILHRCKIHNVIWSARPDHVLDGHGCPVCGGSIRKTHEQYVNEVANINALIEVVGEYINAKTPIKHRCKIDGYIWETVPYAILGGEGCPKCAGNAKKSHEEYVQELYLINKNIEVIGQYMGAHIPILHRCKIDGYEWKVSPSNALNGDGCPCCQESAGERRIRQWLENNDIIYIYQNPFDDCRDKKPLPFDFYLPEYNTCIEYDGEQHYMPIDFAGKGNKWAEEQFIKTKKHDEIKTQYCKDNNIHLLRIPYFKNVEKELNNFYLFNTVTSMAI